jgi:hypothetical protein
MMQHVKEQLHHSYRSSTSAPSSQVSAREWATLSLEDRMCAPVPKNHVAAICAALDELDTKAWVSLSQGELEYLHFALAFQVAPGEIDVVRDEDKDHPLLKVARKTGIPFFDELGFELLPEAPVEVEPSEVVNFPLATADGVHVAMLHVSDGAYWGLMPERLRRPGFFMSQLPSCYGVSTVVDIPSDAVRTRAIQAMMTDGIERRDAKPADVIGSAQSMPRRRRADV